MKHQIIKIEIFKKPFCIFLVAIIVVLSSCQPTELAPLELLKTVRNPDSGLLQEVVQKGFRYSWQYLPVDYQIARELVKEEDYQARMDDIRPQYEGHHYCNFTIASMDGKSMDKKIEQLKGKEAVEQLLTNYNFYSKDAFRLAIGRDTQTCVLYHLDRPNGLQTGLHFSLVFRAATEEVEEDAYLLFDDEHLSEEEIKIKIKKQDIRTVPSLKRK